MKKLSKILFSVLSIVLVLVLMVVPAFADSVRDTTDGVADYSHSWCILNWSGVSTRSEAYDDYFDNGIQDTRTFIISDVFADDIRYTDYTTILADPNQNYANNPYLKYHNGNEERGYNNAINQGEILAGSYSLVNQFTMPSIYFYDDAYENDPFKDGIHLTYVVPQYLADGLIQGTADYLSFDVHYSMEILADDYGQNTPYWYGIEDQVYTYMLGGSNSNPNIFSLEDVEFERSVVGTVPDGYDLITMTLPIEDILSRYSSEGYEGFPDCLLFRDVSFYLTFDYDEDTLFSQITNISDLYGSDEFNNWYFHAVIDNTVYGGRTNHELPLYSVTTDKSNPNQIDLIGVLDIYTQIVSDDVTIINPVQIDSSLVGWLGRTVGAVLDVELFGTFSLSTILYVVFGAGLLFAIIKFFAGG